MPWRPWPARCSPGKRRRGRSWRLGCSWWGRRCFAARYTPLRPGAPRIVGAITPLGGLAFLGGWAVLVWAAGADGASEP